MVPVPRGIKCGSTLHTVSTVFTNPCKRLEVADQVLIRDRTCLGSGQCDRNRTPSTNETQSRTHQNLLLLNRLAGRQLFARTTCSVSTKVQRFVELVGVLKTQVFCSSFKPFSEGNRRRFAALKEPSPGSSRETQRSVFCEF